jgi:hypothetical protein
MKNKLKPIVALVFFMAFIIGCNDDNEVGSVQLEFDNRVGDDILNLNTSTYTKNGDETFNINELKYIISNIVFIDENGNEFAYPQAESYFLINEEFAESKSIILQNIEAKRYASIRFGFGVDQSRYPLNGVNNFVPTAEENGMLWAWAAGYIFLKMEGTYSSTSASNDIFRYHVGSHGTALDNYKEITLDLPQDMVVSEGQTPTVNIELDVLKIFDSQYSLLLSDKDDIQIDPDNAPKIADNVTKSFQIKIN